jgi:hypothetical protein
MEVNTTLSFICAIKMIASNGFWWLFTAMHRRIKKIQFLAELVSMCSREALPILIGGDFNILRNPDKRNNENYNDRWPFLFNAIIDGLNLRGLKMSG